MAESRPFTLMPPVPPVQLLYEAVLRGVERHSWFAGIEGDSRRASAD